MQAAERVGEAGVEQLRELLALLVGKTRVAAVRAGVLQIDLVVCNVEVSAGHHGLRRSRLSRLRQRQPLRGKMPLAHRRRLGHHVSAAFALAAPGFRLQNHIAVGAFALYRHARRQHTGFKPLAEVAERIVPFHAVIDARQLVLRIRRVHAHEPEFRELARHNAAFVIKMRKSQAMQHL